MSLRKEDRVPKQVCLELFDWLENNADSELLNRFTFTLFKAIASDGDDEPSCRLTLSQLLNYCQELSPNIREWSDTYIHRKCSNLSTRLLQPATRKMGMNKYIRITYHEEAPENFFELEYSNSNRLDKMLRTFDDTGISNKQWLNIVAEGIENQYSLKSENCVAVATVTPETKHSSENIVRLHKGQSEKQKTIDHKPNYSYIPQRAIKKEKWEITRLECIVKRPKDVDDEEFNQILKPYKKAAQHAINFHHGRSEQKLDDRIRVHFGGPGGAEAHARCAVKTALQMLQGFERIKYSKKRKHPCPRIYILVYSFNTILSIPRQKQEYPNILSHKAAETLSLLESLNFDHKVVISHETYTSVRHFFDCRKIQDLAKTDAQTKSPIAYQVISDLNILTIFDGTYAEKFPLIGRSKELNRIQNAWDKAQQGFPKLVWIQGMPGIGKSRLIHEFIHGLKDNRPRILICQCWSNYMNTPYYPVVQMLKEHLDIKHEKNSKKKQQRLKFFIEQFGLDMNKTLPVLTALVENLYEGIAPADDSLCKNSYKLAEKAACKEKFPEVLLEILQAIASEPVIVLLKDLQWADPSTAELLGKLLKKVSDTTTVQHILIIGSYRNSKPAFAKGISDIETKPIQLGSLEKKDSYELAEMIAKKTKMPLSTKEMDAIVNKTGGIPHSIYAAIANKDNPDSWFKKIMFDLEYMSEPDDILSPKHIAQIASLLGETFDYELLKNTLFDCMGLFAKLKEPAYDNQIRKNFNTLLDRELIRPRPLANQTVYEFACENIREQVYASISHQDKQNLHLKIAEMFERDIPSILGKISPEIIARHYTEALNYTLDDDAVASKIAINTVLWWHRTAKAAMYKLSLPEAIISLEKAEQLLGKVSPGTEKLKIELQLNLDIATCHELLEGPAAPQVQKAFEKAKAIAQEEGEVTSIFRTQWSDWFYTYLRGNLRQAQDMAKNLLSDPACLQDNICRMEAHHAMWDTLFHCGHLQDAWSHHFEGLLFSENLSKHDHRHGYAGHSARVCCLSRIAILMWFRGLADQSLTMSEKAIRLADSLDHANTKAHAHCHAALLHMFRNELEKTELHATESIKSAKEYSVKSRLIVGQILLEIAKLQKQPEPKIIKSFEANCTQWKSIGIRMFETLWFAIAANAYLEIGNYEEGLNRIQTAISISQETQEGFYLAELHRIHAVLLVASTNRQQDIKKQFNMAMEHAEKSQAKILQLRALASFYQYLKNQGKRSKEITSIKTQLHHCYNSFTEGFDTQDLITAKELIDAP